MNKKIVILFIILLIIIGVTQKNRIINPILSAVMDRAIEARFNSDFIAELDDGLHLALCGAGGPLPAPNASGPCVVVIAGKRMFIVDAGTDGIRNINRMDMPTGDIEAVFITHFHSDHIDGLGEMATIRWVSAANQSPLPVYGPTGLQQIVDGFNQAYSLDRQFRHQHHGDTVAPLSGFGMVANEFTTPNGDTLKTLINDNNLKVETFAVGHAPVDPAVGYRFVYKGRSLLITGDTIAHHNVRLFSKDIDLLVHEALAPNLVKQMNRGAKKTGNALMAKITHDIPDYHTSPMQAAQIAKDANVGHLLYYHIVPPLVIPGQQSLFLNGANQVFPDYTIGEDGVMFSLPANSDKIQRVRDGL